MRDPLNERRPSPDRDARGPDSREQRGGRVDAAAQHEAWLDRGLLLSSGNAERIENVEHHARRIGADLEKRVGANASALAIEDAWAAARKAWSRDEIKDPIHRAYVEDVNLAYATLLDRALAREQAPRMDMRASEPRERRTNDEQKHHEPARERVTEQDRKDAQAAAAEQIARGTARDPTPDLRGQERIIERYLSEARSLFAGDEKIQALVERDVDRLKKDPAMMSASADALKSDLSVVVAERERLRDTDPGRAGKLAVRALALATLHEERAAPEADRVAARPLPRNPATRADEPPLSNLADRVMRFTAARDDSITDRDTPLFVESPSGLIREQRPFVTTEVTGSMVIEVRDRRPPPLPEDTSRPNVQRQQDVIRTDDRDARPVATDNDVDDDVYRPTPAKMIRIANPVAAVLERQDARDEGTEPLPRTQDIARTESSMREELEPRTPVVFIPAVRRDPERTLSMPEPTLSERTERRAQKDEKTRPMPQATIAFDRSLSETSLDSARDNERHASSMDATWREHRGDDIDMSDPPRPAEGLADLSHGSRARRAAGLVTQPEISEPELSASNVFASREEGARLSTDDTAPARRNARGRGHDSSPLPPPVDDREHERERERAAAETREALLRETSRPRLSREDIRQETVDGMRRRFSAHDAAERLFGQLTHESGLAMMERVKAHEDGAPVFRRAAEMHDDPALRTVADVGEALLDELRKPHPERIEVAALATRLQDLLLDMREAGRERQAQAEAAVRYLPRRELEARIEQAARVAAAHPQAADWHHRSVAFIGYEAGRLQRGRETGEALSAYAVFGAANVHERHIKSRGGALAEETVRAVSQQAAAMTTEQRRAAYFQARLSAELVDRASADVAAAWAHVIDALDASELQRRVRPGHDQQPRL